MPKQQQGYEAFIERLKAEWQAADPGESLIQLIERTQAYLVAAETLTKDELALIAQYVKEDLREFEEAPEDTRIQPSIMLCRSRSGAGCWI